ncbi:type II toxin-antitoxin system RelE/ParE family toxin [Prosthecobacter sp.]|jgi:plasmid stabilization system protein ParE|uniref:type II toxin-antitoxin system RelE/ParE family toxin n=1 Tax=Prosthecobacter sp. TaxID=1965333 RepID=UPI003783FDC5
MRLTYHRQVQAEANEAVDWYEEQSPGLGEDFFAKLKMALGQIEAHPEGFSFWLSSSSVRRVKLQRFPYDVLYEIRPGQIRVLCLRHEKRHPRYGSGRS